MLPELPGQVQNEPDQPYGYHNIESRYHIIVGYPPRKDSSPDHDSDIWNKESQNTENSETVQDSLLVHIFSRFC